MSVLANAVGTAAALFSMGSFLPQAVKIVREKDASAVSFRTYLATVTAFVLWTLYGVMLGSWPLVFSNLVTLALAGAVLILKLRYAQKQKGPQSPAAPPAKPSGGSA